MALSQTRIRPERDIAWPAGCNAAAPIYSVYGNLCIPTNGVLNPLAFPGTDICKQINAAITSIPANQGATIQIPAGAYPACTGTGDPNGTAGIGINLNKNSIILEGAAGGLPSLTYGGTTLTMAAGVTGIDVTGAAVIVRQLLVVSQSTAADSGDGIRVRGSRITLRDLGFRRFGRYGVMVNGCTNGGTLTTCTTPFTNANLWSMTNISTYGGYGDGFRWAAPCSDNNGGNATNLDSTGNQGWAFYLECGNTNSFNSTHNSSNTLGGWNVQSSYNTFDGIYMESGTGSSFNIGTGINGIQARFRQYAMPQTITNPISYANRNTLEFPAIALGNLGPGAHNQFNIASEAIDPAHAYYHIATGASLAPAVTPGQFGIVDWGPNGSATSYLFLYDPVARIWTHYTPIAFSPAPPVNHTACFKASGVLGYCSTQPDSTGSCTCN